MVLDDSCGPGTSQCGCGMLSDTVTRLAPTVRAVEHAYHCCQVQLLEKNMSIATIVLIVLLLLLVGAIPAWPHSRSWGYGPSGGLGLVVLVLVVLLLTGGI